MRLSERGAIRSAIAEGGLGLFPAGRLMEMIKAGNPGDELKGDFDPQATVEKLRGARGPEGGAAKAVFDRDIGILAERLGLMPANYDIEAAFDMMLTVAPELAKRYYGVENFEAPRPKVVEYFFEGFSDVYKDGDWFAFNVNSAESAEMNVPVGTYFKRDQVSPGLPEFSAMHEANHAMQEAASLPDGFNHYLPWFDEGLADAFGRMMLYRTMKDEALMGKLRRFRTEVESLDPRKATYHFGEETASLLLLRGRLPFAKALMRARRREPFSVDWSTMGGLIKEGVDPHVAVLKSYVGSKQAAFQKKLDRDEKAFRKGPDLDASDLRALTMFLASERPACLPPEEYAAALWLASEAAKAPDPEQAFKISIAESDVPAEHKNGAAKLASIYFITKREEEGRIVYSPYGGGLPYRLGSGEIRCTY